MAFKRSAVRSRLSPPTQESEKRPGTSVSGLFLFPKVRKCVISNFAGFAGKVESKWNGLFSHKTGGTAVPCVELRFHFFQKQPGQSSLLTGYFCAKLKTVFPCRCAFSAN